MPRENILTTTAARIAHIPFWLFSRRAPFAPTKALILKPCCLSQVMLATPLLTALSKAYPQTRFDWAVSEWARPALNGNPRLTEIIVTSPGSLHNLSWNELYDFSQTLRQHRYDTCIIPSRSGLLSLIAWWARIPQRIGLHANGRGFAHTLPVKLPRTVQHEAAVYLSLASALGVDTEMIRGATMEFYPPDADRTAVTQRLVNENWLGDTPLVILHPGGGTNPVQTDLSKQWPVERFVLLANHIIRKHKARLVLVGAAEDTPIAKDIIGLLPVPIINLVGKLKLGELGALCEVANLYVGIDTGTTHIAAAVGCPTLAIFGPTNPTISGPYATKGKVLTLAPDEPQPTFSWENNVTVSTACQAADQLLT
ncbi:MAG: glycosyltransferase family 9 protein [Ardenticatenaceae bacterium]|nr:glycosyltransferase family 9 protein [Ardenticatenaceae bacterium]